MVLMRDFKLNELTLFPEQGHRFHFNILTIDRLVNHFQKLSTKYCARKRARGSGGYSHLRDPHAFARQAVGQRINRVLRRPGLALRFGHHITC